MLFTMCHVPCEFLSASQASASHAVDPRFGNISTILVSNEIGLVATVAYLVERRVFQPIGRQDLDPYPTSSSSVVSYCRPLSRKAEQVRHPSMEDNYEHRRNLLLATERWTYFLLALLDMSLQCRVRVQDITNDSVRPTFQLPTSMKIDLLVNRFFTLALEVCCSERFLQPTLLFGPCPLSSATLIPVLFSFFLAHFLTRTNDGQKATGRGDPFARIFKFAQCST